jgi:two-component system cell cycle response regulator
MNRTLPTVIIIEPDPVLRRQLQEQLSATWSVRSAPNAYLAVPLFQSVRPALVVIEADLPFVSGLEVCDILKARLPRTAVVVVSRDMKRLAIALESGADAVLAKPFSSQRLQELARDFLAYPQGRRGSAPPGQRAGRQSRSGARSRG